MRDRVIVLNGASSSGTSSIARALQARLPEPWLTFGIDDLVAAMPAAMTDAVAGISVDASGSVLISEDFARLNAAWEHGVAATARAGAPMIVDDVLLSGGAGQERWRAALGDLPALWVGVHCDPAELDRRERARGDRAAGMAAGQVVTVHAGVAYDIGVDTTRDDPGTCADRIVARWLAGAGPAGPVTPAARRTGRCGPRGRSGRPRPGRAG